MPSDPEMGFRLLTRDDFGLLERWLSTPHVQRWWGEPHDLAGVESEFGPCVDGVDPTLVYIVTVRLSDAVTDDRITDDRVADTSQGPVVPIGMVQTYLVCDTPEYEAAVGVVDAAGIDLFIGELDFVGIGLGKAIIARFISEIGWSAFPVPRGTWRARASATSVRVVPSKPQASSTRVWPKWPVSRSPKRSWCSSGPRPSRRREMSVAQLVAKLGQFLAELGELLSNLRDLSGEIASVGLSTTLLGAR